jgi:hypothetical protein
MEALSEQLKDAIIREHPDGLWLVLAEEYSCDERAASDLCFADGCTRFGDDQNN